MTTSERRPKKFNQEENSVDATLSKAPKKIRSKYRKNRAKFDADQRAMERWARDGATSGSEDD